jgi:serine/threonine-protein kinase
VDEGLSQPKHSALSHKPDTARTRPLPLDEAFATARQIADALEAAHEHGIIPRDLKLANIKVREDGTVKVLDFGLAKLTDPVGLKTRSARLQPCLAGPSGPARAGLQACIVGQP